MEKLNEKLTHRSKKIDQLIEKINNNSNSDVNNDIQEVKKARKEQKELIETYYNILMDRIRKDKSILQELEKSLADTGNSSTHTTLSREFQRGHSLHLS